MNKRRHRRPPEDGEYRDPLSNYDPPEHQDPFERSVCEDTVAVIRSTPVLTITPDTSVRDALALMSEHDIASLVVVDQERPVGIVSERDVLTRIAEDYPRLADAPIRQIMTEDPVVVYETDTPARVLNCMASGAFRHLPVVDIDGKLKGVIGARRVIAYLEQHFASA